MFELTSPVPPKQVSYKQSAKGRKPFERQARPAWADLRKMRAWYAEAERRRAAGEDVTVDHIVPIKHPRVCGLDWEGNYQFLSARENSSKSNKFDCGL